MPVRDDDLLNRLLRQKQSQELAEDPERYKRKAQIILDQLLPMQRLMAEDWHKRICLLTPGKNGKSWTVRARLVHKALTVKNANLLYIGLSRDAAKRDIWTGPTGIRTLCEEIGLRVERADRADQPGVDVAISEQEMTATFVKTGAVIRVAGADNMDAIEKFRGGRGYDEVWIDEAKSHSPALLKELIEEILTPRVNWKDGVIGICGTPGDILAGLFYALTRDDSEMSVPYGEENPNPLTWSCHRWSLSQNTVRLPGQTTSAWERALALKAANKWTDRNTTWRREFLGQWCAELTDHVYKFQKYDDETGEPWNIWAPLERTVQNPFGLFSKVKVGEQWQPIKWRFGIGMDMGEHDPFALVVLAISEQLPNKLYEVHEVIKRFRSEDTPGAKPFSRVDFIGESLKNAIGLIQQYDDYPLVIVADMAHMGEAILTEVLIKYQVRVKKAQKQDKEGSIGLVNDDLVDGRMFLLEAGEVASQMAGLQYDETGKRELPGQKNDACDATLYLRGELTRFLTRGVAAVLDATTDEERRVADLLAQANTNKSPFEQKASSYGSNFSSFKPGQRR